MAKNFKSLITNKTWLSVYEQILQSSKCYNYRELIGVSYTFDPTTDHVMTTNSNLFDLKKAAAMYFWYKKGDRTDTSILKYFDEYKSCISPSSPEFNSNYGYYAYTERGLEKCIRYLAQNKSSRQACFCINNNAAMLPQSIDKLCTNTIQFFIRNDRLEMVVQMRSSNFLTLLPYDAFMFVIFYQHVYSTLRRNNYHDLRTGLVYMQVASLHFYTGDKQKYKETEPIDNVIIENFTDNNWQLFLESKLLKALKS